MPMSTDEVAIDSVRLTYDNPSYKNMSDLMRKIIQIWIEMVRPQDTHACTHYQHTVILRHVWQDSGLVTTDRG